MELDLLSLFRLHVHSCTHLLRSRTPPPLGSYTRALLVSQDKHLFVTPWSYSSYCLGFTGKTPPGKLHKNDQHVNPDPDGST
jgi:hypothetical protein